MRQTQQRVGQSQQQRNGGGGNIESRVLLPNNQMVNTPRRGQHRMIEDRLTKPIRMTNNGGQMSPAQNQSQR